MHEEVIRYYVEGIHVDSSNLVKNKERWIHFIEGGMRDEGCVPLLDMEPQYTQSWDNDEQHFVFQLSVYGVFVGREKAWDVAGVMIGKTVPRSTRHVKLSQS